MAIYSQKSGANIAISDAELQEMVLSAIEKSGKTIKRMLLLPPDHTRLNSCAGRITEMIYEKYADQCHIDIMPALGTHSAMTDAQLEAAGVGADLIRLSCGLENAQDLIADLAQALA